MQNLSEARQITQPRRQPLEQVADGALCSARPLVGLNVLIVTSGHDLTDSRIYSKQACSIQNLGANVTLVGKLEGNKPDEIEVLTVSKPSSRLIRFLWQPWRCLWAARGLDPDIIHFHDAEMLMTLPLAKLWWRQSKFVYDVHEDFANLMLVRDWLPGWAKPLVKILTNGVEKGLALLADAIVGVTPPLAEKFSNKEKIVAYNYVARKFFERAAAANRKPQERQFDLIHVGTLNSKRAGFLADTVQELQRLKPSARFLVVGASPETEAIIRRKTKPENCVLLGKIPHEEIADRLADAKVGLDVHPWLGPHLQVALPVKVCEYMAAGCAVVSSAMPVLNEILDEVVAHSECIEIINGGKPADYARAASKLIDVIEKGADPGSELRRVALERMVWEKEAAKIGELYRRLMGQPCVA
jgi:glycosyltransferase involved in cell wall biosynthesis